MPIVEIDRRAEIFPVTAPLNNSQCLTLLQVMYGLRPSRRDIGPDVPASIIKDHEIIFAKGCCSTLAGQAHIAGNSSLRNSIIELSDEDKIGLHKECSRQRFLREYLTTEEAYGRERLQAIADKFHDTCLAAVMCRFPLLL